VFYDTPVVKLVEILGGDYGDYFFSLSKLPNVYKQKLEKKQRDFVLEHPNIDYHYLLLLSISELISFTHPPPPRHSIGQLVSQRGGNQPNDCKEYPPWEGLNSIRDTFRL